MTSVTPQLAADVYMDYMYRQHWDSYVKDLRQVSTNGNVQHLYWQVNFPFPLWNRDYTFAREMREFDLNDRHVWVVMVKGVDLPDEPEQKGVVRVKEYFQSMTLTSNGQGGTQAYMKYFDNPGGNIPTWLINWGAKTGIPKFLDQMLKACENYKTFQESNSKGDTK